MTDRTILIQYLKNTLANTSLANTSFRVSDNLPFTNAATPVYLKNFRTLYVSDTESDTVPLFLTLDAHDVNVSEFTHQVVFAQDAKSRNTGTDAVLGILRQAGSVFPNQIDSGVTVTQEIADDYQIVTAEVRFRRI